MLSVWEFLNEWIMLSACVVNLMGNVKWMDKVKWSGLKKQTLYFKTFK